MKEADKATELSQIFKEYVTNTFVHTYFIMQLLSRIILMVIAYNSGQISLSNILSILSAGFFADFIATFFWLPIVSVFQRIKYGRYAGHFLFSLILVFALISQIIFWDEFGTNFNFIAVDYLVYTHEIWGTLKESLPIYSISAAVIIFAACISSITLKFSKKAPSIKLILAMLICCVTIGAMYDSEKIGPTNNKYAHEISKNGHFEFFNAYFNNGLDYMNFYPTTGTHKALNTVKSILDNERVTFLKNDNLGRNIANPEFFLKKNVVVIMVESLSAKFLTHFGNNENITPNLDRIAKESLFFTNIYATGTRTVRGLEALTLSIPPLPGSSIIRRPNNNGLFTIGSPFRDNGYVTDFMYGGYSYFDNQQNYFTSNHFLITDRSDLSKDEISFSNIWGVADEDIFNKAIERFDSRHKREKNFFSIIMTTSNHRPYNFPEGRIDLPSGAGRSAAVKYTDYAIGKFLEDAKTKPWFKDTVFVITADHCASSAGKTNLPAHKYHIPLMIYAPSIVKPGINNNLGSQIDIGPTILGMLGFSYTSKFYGQDLTRYNPNRAFISTYQLLGFLKDDKLVILSPNNPPATFMIEGDKQILMNGTKKLEDEAISYYQSAYELFTQNEMKEGL